MTNKNWVPSYDMQGFWQAWVLGWELPVVGEVSEIIKVYGFVQIQVGASAVPIKPITIAEPLFGKDL